MSKSLVSLVLQDSPKVSPARRQAVLDAAAELGYRPNAVARSLVLRRTHVIGLVVSDLNNPFFAEACEAIQKAAKGTGYRVLVGSSGRSAAGERELADAFLELRVDGVMLLSPVLSRQQMQRISRAAPTVVLGRHEAYAAGIETVLNDDVRGVELGVTELAKLGHRRIAHVTGGRGAGSAQRRQGYLQAMRRYGLQDCVQLVEGEFTEHAGYRAARELLAGSTPPTAILAANDLVAIGALQAIEEAGRRVPADLSLVGYDNSHLAQLLQFSLTSVDQQHSKLGDLAVTTLLDRIATPDSPVRKRVVDPRLVVRRTTGPPRGSEG